MFLIDEIAGQEAQEVAKANTTKPTISVRELLHMRVELEWHARQEKIQKNCKPDWVQADAAEKRLNTKAAEAGLGLFADGTEPKERQLGRMYRAVEKAFNAQSIFVLLDDRQAESLAEVVEVKRTASATFLLLTPLQGG